jgi:undecaprenyl-diphosphatase
MSTREMIAAVAAVLVAAFLVWRWRRLALERKVIGALIFVALAVYASGVLAELPDPKKVIEDIATALGPWTYALVGVMAFLETGAFVGLVAPGETVVIAGGVVAGQGEIQLVPLIGLVWVCAVLGDTTSFYIGRRLGRRFLERHGPRFKITEERLEQVEAFFARRGGVTILIGRFIGIVRALAPFVAGASKMPFRKFLPYDVVGSGLWATTFVLLGYFSWRNIDKAAQIASRGTLAVGTTATLGVAVFLAHRFLRTPEQRDEVRRWWRGRREGDAVEPSRHNEDP